MILSRLAVEEKKLGVSLDYLRFMVRTSLPAFFKFTKIMPIASFRRKLPPAPYFVARLIATRDEDCGTCLQIEINLAKQAGLSGGLIRAVVDRRPDELPAELADLYAFVEQTVGPTVEDQVLRRKVVEHWGEEGLVELTLAIAASRFFPMAKKTLGFATSCSLVRPEI